MEEVIRRLTQRLWQWRIALFLAGLLVLGALVNLIGYGLPIRSEADVTAAKGIQHVFNAITSALAPVKWWLAVSPQPTQRALVSAGNLATVALIGFVVFAGYTEYTVRRELARQKKNEREAEDELAKEVYKKQRRG